MAIGTSLGAYFPSAYEFHSQIQPPPGDEAMEMNPTQMQTNKELMAHEDELFGGIEVAFKNPSVNPPGMTYGKYDTPLSAYDELQYQKKFNPKDSEDYDMRGWYKDNPGVNPNAPGVHYPDTYKKPNHPTFSMDSKYNGIDGQFGGVWGKEDGKDTFTPSSHNLKNMTKDQLQDYFKRVEPKGILKLPQPDIEDRRDDTTLHTYQEWLDGNANNSAYKPEDNKELENRPYTKLEKEAGMVDLDKTNLDQIIKAIQKGQSLK